MASARKYTVVDDPKPKRRVKRCSPISLCELLFCDWDYEVDADADLGANSQEEAEKRAWRRNSLDVQFAEANGEGYEELQSPPQRMVGGKTSSSSNSSNEDSTEATVKVLSAVAKGKGEEEQEGKGEGWGRREYERGEEREEETEDEESVRAGQSFSHLRDSFATKHNSPLKISHATPPQSAQSSQSLLDIHHEGEEGKEGEGGAGENARGSGGDYRGRRPPSLKMPHSPPGTSPARESDERSEHEAAAEAAAAATAATIPSAVNEEYEESSSQRGHHEEEERERKMKEASSSYAVNERSVDQQRGELYPPPTPEYGRRALASLDAGLTPTSALKKLMGADAGDTYQEARGRLGLEEELDKPLVELYKLNSVHPHSLKAPGFST
jgi:hypothetical protein